MSNDDDYQTISNRDYAKLRAQYTSATFNDALDGIRTALAQGKRGLSGRPHIDDAEREAILAKTQAKLAEAPELGPKQRALNVATVDTEIARDNLPTINKLFRPVIFNDQVKRQEHYVAKGATKEDALQVSAMLAAFRVQAEWALKSEGRISDEEAQPIVESSLKQLRDNKVDPAVIAKAAKLLPHLVASANFTSSLDAQDIAYDQAREETKKFKKTGQTLELPVM